MKKVGIITIYHNNRNYGGLLQAYALRQSISNLGYKCDIIDYTQNAASYKFSRMCNLGLKRTFEVVRNKVLTKIQYRRHPALKKSIDLRNGCLHSFEASIPHTATVHDDGIEAKAAEYDILVCGSDQIWNPGLWSPSMFLDIPKFSGKRLSYAASIGRNQLTTKEQDYISKHAQGLNHISVREKSAEKMLKQILKKEVITVLDPTFLINPDEWKAFARKPEGVSEKYVFSFFLGNNESAKKMIYDTFSKEMPVITIPHLQTGFKAEDEKYSTIQLYKVGPREWVWLILNAQAVLTDSFHGTAFSINLNKEVFSFPKGSKEDKQSINSRLSDLLKMCGIENRFLTDCSTIKNRVHEKIDWTSVNEKLDREKRAARDYLIKSLSD